MQGFTYNVVLLFNPLEILDAAVFDPLESSVFVQCRHLAVIPTRPAGFAASRVLPENTGFRRMTVDRGLTERKVRTERILANLKFMPASATNDRTIGAIGVGHIAPGDER